MRQTEHKRDQETERKTDRQTDRERQLRLRGSEGGYVSFPQSRMNHSSLQSQASGYVRLRKNCPFVLKKISAH